MNSILNPILNTLLVAVCLMEAPATAQITARDASSTGSQASGALGILGDRFTVGGQPTFLLGVSYFDALGWNHADLDALRARRFNLIRIFLDWSILAIKDGVPSPLAPRGFLNPDGSLKNTETLLNLIRACADRGIVVDVTVLTAIYDASNPTSKTLDAQSRENAVRGAVRLLKHEPNVFFDVCNEHDVAWNGKTTTLTHAEVAALIRVALAEHPGAIVTVSSGGDHLPNAQNVRAELDAGAMLIAPHFQRTPDWFDRTDDRIKAVKEDIKAAGRKVPVYLQEEQRRGWTKLSPPKSEFLQAAREAVSAGAAGWVFHTHAGFDLRSSNFLANLDSVEREILDSLGAEVFGAAPPLPGKSGPLRVHPTNPRYFSDGTKNPDGSLRAVYLTGSHTWNNLLDMGRDDPPKAFDFDAYLDFLERHGHNFIRLWAWDSALWDTHSALAWVEEGAIYHVAPQPWMRTGPGQALDGKPKFNLEQLDPAYFERLRSRVQAAGKRGIYVSVMLFEGWALSFDSTSWRGHPFRLENNVQGINGDPNGDGKGLEIQTLTIPGITAAQEAYVRKVIDAVNDLDNVLYEISNEARLLNPASSTKDWQYHLIRFIKNEEAKKPKQHPVGMTSQGGGGGDDSEILRNSPADWISPNSDKFDYKNNPPASDGTKVILLDTDHLWGVGGDAAWVWKSFLRGHNPLFMDPYAHDILGKGRPDQWEGARQALGATRGLARRIDLARMTPSLDLASTRYCLANPGQGYLVYQPGTGEFSVNLAAGNHAFEWFNPTTRAVVSTGSVKTAGGNHTFTPPFAGPAVLSLKRSPDASAREAGQERNPRTIRVAAAQADGRVIDFRLSPSNALVAVERNLMELERIIDRAGREQCDVLVLPEDTPGLLNWLGANEVEARGVLPAAVKRMIERLGSAAARHKMYLVVCSDHLETDGGLYNTAFLLGRDGREIGRYHKTCPTWAESAMRRRGTDFPVFPTPDLGTAGMLICYDLVMPETARALALQGTDIIFFPTMGGAAIGDDDIGVQALRVRAVENFVWLVVAQRGDGAMIISPQGKIISQAHGPDGLAIADIDPRAGREGGDSSNRQHDMRARLFRERNPAAFSILTDPDPPVLAKVPIAITKEDAGRIMNRMLTVGEEEFKQAVALERAGRTREAIAAFEKLTNDYRGTWIDRASRERLAKAGGDAAASPRLPDPNRP